MGGIFRVPKFLLGKWLVRSLGRSWVFGSVEPSVSPGDHTDIGPEPGEAGTELGE